MEEMSWILTFVRMDQKNLSNLRARSTIFILGGVNCKLKWPIITILDREFRLTPSLLFVPSQRKLGSIGAGDADGSFPVGRMEQMEMFLDTSRLGGLKFSNPPP